MQRALILAGIVVGMATLGVRAASNTTPPLVVPMSGSIVDAQNQPVAGADVILERQATSATGGQSLQTVASGRTDARGGFTLDVVSLDTEVRFPLETEVRLTYGVRHADRSAAIDSVTFTAPRSAGAITSVEARIRLK